MYREGAGAVAENNVIHLDAARERQESRSDPTKRGCVYVREGEDGELELGMEAIAPADAMRFLRSMLYLSEVLIKTAMGEQSTNRQTTGE